jgi:hypothetical protein
LFRLEPAGLYPTLEARLEHALRRIEAAKAFVRKKRKTELSPLRVASPLKFALGRVSKAASTARALAARISGIFFDIEFELHVRWMLAGAAILREVDRRRPMS